MASLEQFESVDPFELADFLVERRGLLPRAVKERLADAFAVRRDGTVGERGDLDLYAEVRAQLAAVKSLRESVITSGGELVAGVRDAKEALSAATSLLKLLVDLEGEILNQNRVRNIQKATVEALSEASPELVGRFKEALRRKLEES